MRVYLVDYVYIFIIKTLIRLVHPIRKKEPKYYENLNLGAIIISIYISIPAFALLGIMASYLNTNLNATYISISLAILHWLFMLVRYVHNDRWQNIERAIDQKHGKETRDVIFSIMILSYFIVATFYIASLMMSKGEAKQLFRSFLSIFS